ncbi:hypothetical protein ACG7TL_008803 [Trametes sanguinea]
MFNHPSVKTQRTVEHTRKEQLLSEICALTNQLDALWPVKKPSLRHEAYKVRFLGELMTDSPTTSSALHYPRSHLIAPPLLPSTGLRTQGSRGRSTACPDRGMAPDLQQSAKDPQESSAQDLENARRALDTAARLKGPGRAGNVEQVVVNSIDTASNTSSSGGCGILLDGVNALVDSLPPLVHALDAIAQIHPILSVAVGAFKVVVELEVKRHDNDKKVNLLFLEMRNMMTVLLQLQSVRDNHIGRDGLTIGKRLEDVVEKAAQDIKECANACDAYARKRLLAKVLKAPSWDATLKDYIQRFVDRKAEFSFAISLHTGYGIDRANNMLDTLLTNIHPDGEAFRMDVVLDFFQKAVPREQRILMESIRTVGGPDTVLGERSILQKVVQEERQLVTLSLRASKGVPNQVSSYQDMPHFPAAPSRHFTAASRPSTSAPRPSTTAPSSRQYPRSAETQRLYYAPQSRWPRDIPSEERNDAGYRPTTRYPPTARMPAYQEVPDSMAYSSRYPALRTSRNPPFVGYSFVDGWEMYNALAGQNTGDAGELEQLVRDLAEEPAVAIRRNFEWFERRFALQQRVMLKVIQKVVVRESDRVITTVMAGPHERIIDKRWRGIVKTRHFILAIHDYYTQKFDDQQRASATFPPAISSDDSDDSDAWALPCVDLKHLHRIVEALDVDLSGFITTQEANLFTISRPAGWSVLRWLAYWAVGWQAAMTEYKRRIHVILGLMHKLVSSVRPCRASTLTRDYLPTVKPLADTITGSFCDSSLNSTLSGKFQEFVDQQEATIRERLETANYCLDTLDTLALVNGPSGLERNVFIILYLLLRRHYDIMRVGQKVLLHPEELRDAAASVTVIADAFNFRAQDLAAWFSQRRLIVGIEMEDFACGMYSGVHSGSAYAPSADMEPHLEEDVDDTIPGLSSEEELPETVLRYPPFLEEFYPETDHCMECDDAGVAETLKPLLGQWSGVTTSEFSRTGTVDKPVGDTLPGYQRPSPLATTIFDYHFHASPMDPNQLVATRATPLPLHATRFTVTMEYIGKADDRRATYRMTESWNSNLYPSREIELALAGDGLTLVSGQQGTPSCEVVMKKGLPPEIMVFYPSPTALRENRPRALWRFALDAVLYDVRRSLFTWDFIKQRRDTRRRVVLLLYAQRAYPGIQSDEYEELNRLLSTLPPADNHFYAHMAQEQERFSQLVIVSRCIHPLRSQDQPPTIFERDECAVAHLDSVCRLPTIPCHLFLEASGVGHDFAAFAEKVGLTTAILDELSHAAVMALSRSDVDTLQMQVSDKQQRDDDASDEYRAAPLPPVVSEAALAGGSLDGLAVERDSLSPEHMSTGPFEEAATDPVRSQSSVKSSGPSTPFGHSEGDPSSDTAIDPDPGIPVYPNSKPSKGPIESNGHLKAHVLLLLWKSHPNGPNVRFTDSSSSSAFLDPVSSPAYEPDPSSPMSFPWLDTPTKAMAGHANVKLWEASAAGFNAIASRFDTIEERLQGFEERMAGLDVRLERMNEMLAAVLAGLHGGSACQGKQ